MKNFIKMFKRPKKEIYDSPKLEYTFRGKTGLCNKHTAEYVNWCLSMNGSSERYVETQPKDK